MTTKKAIVLLDPLYISNITELRKSLIAYFQQSNCEIIKLIHVRNHDDCKTLEELINIVKAQDQTTTVIIKDKSYLSFTNIMTCCVLGTLEMSGLIDIATYQESNECNPLEFNIAAQEQIKFLPIAWLHLEQLLSLVKTSLLH